MAFGKNINILDGKLCIEPEEWLIPIKDDSHMLEKQYNDYKIVVHGRYSIGKNEVFESIRTVWLGIVDKVRTKLLGLSGDIFIPELSLG